MNTMIEHIERAVAIHGSQNKLADEVGCSQQYISLLIQGKCQISAEMALQFDKATGGVVSKSDLRPDIFETGEAA